MLKIKNEVDLKELEKFGFEYEKAHRLFSDRYIHKGLVEKYNK